MKHKIKPCLVLFLALFLTAWCGASGQKVKGIVMTFHIEGDETETEKFVTPVKLGSDHKQYFFRKIPSFTDRDMLWFYPFVAQDGQSFGAAFRLKDHKGQELLGLTTSNQGRLLGTRVLDAPLRAVVIDRPVNDSIVVIWDGLSKAHIQLLNTKIPHVEEFQGRVAPETPQFNLPATQPTPDQTKRSGLFSNTQRDQTPAPTQPSPNDASKRPFGKLFQKRTDSQPATPQPATASANPYTYPGANQ